MGSQIEKLKNLESHIEINLEELPLYNDDDEIGDQFTDFEINQFYDFDENDYSWSKAKVISRKNHKVYMMENLNIQHQFISNCFDQISKLKDLNHPYIIKYYKFFQYNNNFLLIREFMNPDIDNYIKANQAYNIRINEEYLWNILLQCLSALEYLHKQNLGNSGIKLGNIYMRDEQNIKIGIFNPFPYNNNLEDINILGNYFYNMCLYQLEAENEKKPIYSKELIDIIYLMKENDHKNFPNYYNLFGEVKKIFIQKYARNTSISAVFRCLYSYHNFYEIIYKNAQKINISNQKYYIYNWVVKIIELIFESKKEKFNEYIEDFRLEISSKYPELEENKEINPFIFLIFLLEKIHKETNKIIENNEEIEEKNEKNIINSPFDAEKLDKSNKEQMLNNFITYFKNNVNSPISDLFCGIILSEIKCQICENINYSFSNFCFIYFDISNNNNKNFDLVKDGFENKKLLSVDKTIYCEKCLIYQKHSEYNKYYKMPHQLIIYFYRGNNYNDNSAINFDEKLNVNKYIEEKDLTKEYYLTGSINRIIDKGKEKFIYYIRDPNNKNILFLNDFKEQIDFNNNAINKIQSNGQIVLLFYNIMDIKK